MTSTPSRDLVSQILAFCATERSYWDLLQRFDILDSPWRQALREAVDSKQLTKRQGPDAFYFATTFPGVDIDRVHSVRRSLTHAGTAGESQP